MNASKNHWTDEDLLTRLYGLDARPHLAPAHLDECAECAERWARVSSARAEVLAAASSAACSEEELRAQRAAVWNRIERPGHVRLLRAVPALATCCVLLLAVALNQIGRAHV
mgnify:FL=1